MFCHFLLPTKPSFFQGSSELKLAKTMTIVDLICFTLLLSVSPNLLTPTPGVDTKEITKEIKQNVAKIQVSQSSKIQNLCYVCSFLKRWITTINWLFRPKPLTGFSKRLPNMSTGKQLHLIMTNFLRIFSSLVLKHQRFAKCWKRVE